MLANKMPDEAADTAYNVYLRTMEAYLFESGQQPPKDHGRTRINFLKASMNDDRIDPSFGEKIANAAKLKNANDYGADLEFISQEQATEVVAGADKFYHTVKTIIANPNPKPKNAPAP
jgi:uncharacterized protein (UPF0332 family)